MFFIYIINVSNFDIRYPITDIQYNRNTHRSVTYIKFHLGIGLEIFTSAVTPFSVHSFLPSSPSSCPSDLDHR